MGFTNPYPASRLTVDSTNSLGTGLLLWAPLTEGSGTTADCIVHAGHAGTQSGGVSWASTDIGTAASFDGVDDRFDFGTFSNYDAHTNAVTVSMWCYLKNDSIQQYFFNKHDSGNSVFRFYAWTGSDSTAKNLELVVRDASTSSAVRQVYSGLVSQLVNKWTHIVFVSSGSNFTLASNLSVYVDGVLQSASTSFDGDGFNDGENSTGIFSLGGRYYDNNRNMEADFQNVRVYDRALSAAEVTTLYHRPWEGTNYGDIWPYSPPVPSSMTLSTDTAATSLMTNCVGWWPLTTTTGNTTEDISGQGNDATKTGAAWEDVGVGYAFEQVPTEAGLNAGSSANNFHGSNFSVSAWVWTDEVASTGSKWVWGCWNNSNGSIAMRVRVNQIWVYHDAGYSLYATNAVEAKTWHHVLVTYDGSTIRIYVDGVFVKQDGRTLGASNTEPFYIGQKDNSTSSSFDGYIQNVRTWSRTLSADEALLLYERPWEGIEYGDTFHYDPPAPASMLPLTSDAINTDQIGWWPLTETNDYASGAADISGNAYDGTKNGTITSESAALGTVANFDGSTGYFQHSNTLAQSFTNSFSVSFWARPESSASDQRAVTNWVTPGNTGAQWNVWLDVVTGGIRWAAAIYDQSGTYQIAGTTVASATLNEWQHVCATWSSSSTDLLVYVDGVEMASITASNMFASTASTSFQIGNSATESKYFDGDIANVRVWTRELTSTEVWSIYENPWLGSNYKLASGSSSTPLYNYIFRTERFRRLG
jgi:hypothetical protein